MDEGVPVPRSEPGIQPKVLFAIVPAIGVLIYNATLMPKNGVLHVIGSATAMGFLLLVATVLAYLLSRQSVRTATVTYCVVSGFLLLSQVGAHRRMSREQEWAPFRGEILPVIHGTAERMRRSVSGEGEEPLSQDQIRMGLIQAFRRAATRLDGAPRRATLGLAAFFEDLREEGRTFHVVYAELQSVVPVDFAAFTSIEELRRQVRVTDRYEQACRHLIEIMRTLPDRLHAMLRSEGVPDVDIEGLVTGFASTDSLAQVTHVRELDIELMKSLRAMLQLLDEHWGQWEWNAETLDLETASDELKQAVIQHLSRFQAVSDEQEDLQRDQIQKFEEKIEAAFE